jgi:hypothetical protein
MIQQREELMKEWEAIRTALLYFGNRRFAQFTVFLAVTTVLFKGFMDCEKCTQYRLPIAITGVALTILFLAMECLSVYRRDMFALRAKQIEKTVKSLRLMSEFRRDFTIKLEAWGIYAVHMIILALWMGLLANKNSIPWLRAQISEKRVAIEVWAIMLVILVCVVWCHSRRIRRKSKQLGIQETQDSTFPSCPKKVVELLKRLLCPDPATDQPKTQQGNTGTGAQGSNKKP